MEAQMCRRKFLLLDRASSSQEVDDQHDERHDEQQVNQAAADMGQKAEEPEDDQDHEQCPQE